METVYFFKQMNPAEEQELRDYFSKKLPSLEKLMTAFPDDGALLKVTGEKFKKHSAFEVELTLKFLSETLTAREASHTIMKAVDLAKDRLTMQLKKNLLASRRGHRSIKARGKASARAALPELRT